MGQYNFTMQDYAQKISQLQTEIAGYNAQAAYYRQRLGIAANVEDMRKDLQHLQVGSQLDTLAATDDRVNIQSELASAVSSVAADQRQLASQQAERDSFDQQWRANISQQLLTALNDLAQAQQQLTKAQAEQPAGESDRAAGFHRAVHRADLRRLGPATGPDLDESGAGRTRR